MEAGKQKKHEPTLAYLLKALQDLNNKVEQSLQADQVYLNVAKASPSSHSHDVNNKSSNAECETSATKCIPVGPVVRKNLRLYQFYTGKIASRVKKVKASTTYSKQCFFKRKQRLSTFASKKVAAKDKSKVCFKWLSEEKETKIIPALLYT